MPTTNELVAQRPLAGHDLAKIILKDVEDILSRDYLYSGQIAYSRIAYEIRVTLHVDNPNLPGPRDDAGRTMVDTTIIAQLPPDDKPELSAIEGAPPLADPSPDSYLSSVERHRDIPSPNAARIASGLPVTVIARDTSTGHTHEEEIKYSPDSIPPGAMLEPIDTDMTRLAKEEMARQPKKARRAK